jgi:hypothetical protein
MAHNVVSRLLKGQPPEPFQKRLLVLKGRPSRSVIIKFSLDFKEEGLLLRWM